MLVILEDGADLLSMSYWPAAIRSKVILKVC